MNALTHPVDLADVKGQEHVKRALEVAAAGAHPVLLVGPPGAGKTLLARAMATILPVPTTAEGEEIGALYASAGMTTPTGRPFRAPRPRLLAA